MNATTFSNPANGTRFTLFVHGDDTVGVVARRGRAFRHFEVNGATAHLFGRKLESRGYTVRMH